VISRLNKVPLIDDQCCREVLTKWYLSTANPKSNALKIVLFLDSGLVVDICKVYIYSTPSPILGQNAGSLLVVCDPYLSLTIVLRKTSEWIPKILVYGFSVTMVKST